MGPYFNAALQSHELQFKLSKISDTLFNQPTSSNSFCLLREIEC